MHRHRMCRAWVTAGGLAAAGLFLCTPARADEGLIWNWAVLNPDGVTASGIAIANPDSGQGQDLSLGSAPVDHPLGVVLDSATDTLYWVNFGGSRNYCNGPLVGGQTISFAGPTGGGTLNTSGATVSGPDGLAIDPYARRLYWANDHANSISYANLDGSGGHDLPITGATLNCPAGLAVDPAAGRVYWTNYLGNTISYANLDGSGAADLNVQGVYVKEPWGLAIDSVHGKIYWANYGTDEIDYANLDGSGGGILNTAGADVNGPWGVAVDPFEGKVYWANNLGGSLGWAWLDGSGAWNLAISGATTDHPKAPILVQPPIAGGAPLIGGASTVGSRLSCSQGEWGEDLPEAFLFRAPSLFSFSWSDNGVPLQTSASSIVADAAGRYVCNVTGTNLAGSSTASSTPFDVHPGATVSVASVTVSRSRVITLSANVGESGSLTAVARFKRRGGSARYGSASISGAGPFTLTIKPSRAVLRLLPRQRHVTVTILLAFTAADGSVARANTSVAVVGRTGGR